MIRKTKHNDQEEHQQLDEEEYQTDQQFEQERFTDEYRFKMMRIKQIGSPMTITKISKTS